MAIERHGTESLRNKRSPFPDVCFGIGSGDNGPDPGGRLPFPACVYEAGGPTERRDGGQNPKAPTSWVRDTFIWVQHL